MHPDIQNNPKLRARYGLDHKNNGLVLIIVLIVTALISWLIWSATYYSNPKLSSQLIAYQNVGNNQIKVTYQVKSSKINNQITCRLVARDIYRNIVGETNDLIDKPNQKIFTRTITLNTLSPAVNADVVGCE